MGITHTVGRFLTEVRQTPGQCEFCLQISSPGLWMLQARTESMSLRWDVHIKWEGLIVSEWCVWESQQNMYQWWQITDFLLIHQTLWLRPVRQTQDSSVCVCVSFDKLFPSPYFASRVCVWLLIGYSHLLASGSKCSLSLACAKFAIAVHFKEPF